jgi:hypothetical protein
MLKFRKNNFLLQEVNEYIFIKNIKNTSYYFSLEIVSANVLVAVF